MTMISRAELGAYTETLPFFELLKSLFEAKGYAGVRITHGADERGRDLVMDQMEGETKLNIAVVVKSKKVTGNTNGRGSAAEIYYQVRQCFGEPTIDAESLVERTVDEVIVITNKTFTEPALKSLKSTCGAECSGKVRFWNGDRLWAEVLRYLGPQSLLDEIKRIVNRVERFDEHYILAPYGYRKTGCGSIGEIRYDDIVLEISERYPGSSEIQPYTISLRSRGAAALALQQALTGRGGIVKGDPGEMEVTYPPILASIMEGTSLGELHIVPHQREPLKVEVSTITLTAIGSVGDQTEYGPIDLRFDSSDESGATFSNSAQSVALQVLIKSLGEGRAGKVGFGLKLPRSGTTARDLIATVRFLDRLHKAVALVISNHALPTPGVQTLPAGTYSQPPKFLRDFVDDLETVLARTSLRPKVPPSWTEDQRSEIHTIAELLRGFSADEYVLGLDGEAATSVACHQPETGMHQIFQIRFNCFDASIALKLHLRSPSLSVHLVECDDGGTVPVKFIASAGSKIQIFAVPTADAVSNATGEPDDQPSIE